jgi:hypothetical protein
MKMDRRISQIIDISTPDLTSSAETVDSILEKYPQFAPELRPRLEAVLWLNQARISCATRPGFIIDSRKYLETQIQSMPPKGFWRSVMMRYSPQRWVFTGAAFITMLLLLSLVINNIVLTARLSIPGDPLYTTKLAIEDLQLALTINQVHKTNLLFQFSQERTTEFVELVLEGDYALLPAAAARSETEFIAYLHSINKLKNQDLTQALPKNAELRETLSNEIVMLNMLQDALPLSAHPGIELAVQDAQAGLLALR